MFNSVVCPYGSANTYILPQKAAALCLVRHHGGRRHSNTGSAALGFLRTASASYIHKHLGEIVGKMQTMFNLKEIVCKEIKFPTLHLSFFVCHLQIICKFSYMGRAEGVERQPRYYIQFLIV